jgi:hypothetical protein
MPKGSGGRLPPDGLGRRSEDVRDLAYIEIVGI